METKRRCDGRKLNQMRKVKFIRNYTKWAEGSVYMEMGDTKILTNATVSQGVPPFLDENESGWITAEYALLPRSTDVRVGRKPNSRAIEISRLVARALRAGINLTEMPGYTITVDCDVIQADGGTRCAAITSGFVALYDALQYMKKEGMIEKLPVRAFLAAISLGIIEDEIYVDLCFEEDSKAGVDINLVMDEFGNILEIQGTSEKSTFNKKQLDKLFVFGRSAIKKLIKKQKAVLKVE